jgi:hypothetical protein
MRVTIPLSLAMMLVNLGTLGAVANGLGPLKNGHLTVHGRISETDIC